MGSNFLKILPRHRRNGRFMGDGQLPRELHHPHGLVDDVHARDFHRRANFSLLAPISTAMDEDPLAQLFRLLAPFPHLVRGGDAVEERVTALQRKFPYGLTI